MDELDQYPVAGKDELDQYPPPGAEKGSTGKPSTGGGVSRGDELSQPDPSPAPLLEGDAQGNPQPMGTNEQAAQGAVAQGSRAGLDANPIKDDWIAREIISGVALGGAGKVAGAIVKPLGRGAVALAESGKVGNAVQKVADVTAKYRHMASTAGVTGALFGHHGGVGAVAADAAVTVAPKLTRALERGVVKLGNLVTKSGVPEKTIMEQATLAKELRTAEMHASERKAVDEAKDLAKDAFDHRLSQSERYAATKAAFEKLGKLGNEDVGI